MDWLTVMLGLHLWVCLQRFEWYLYRKIQHINKLGTKLLTSLYWVIQINVIFTCSRGSEGSVPVFGWCRYCSSCRCWRWKPLHQSTALWSSHHHRWLCGCHSSAGGQHISRPPTRSDNALLCTWEKSFYILVEGEPFVLKKRVALRGMALSSLISAMSLGESSVL